MVTDGRFGPQYLEGIGGLTPETQKRCPISEYEKKYVDQALTFYPDIIDGNEINLMMHDGEESDTTLIPFYGYKTYDDPVVRNYARFSASEENPTYGTECRGIKWGHESGATFPGYTTAFSGIVDEETMNGRFLVVVAIQMRYEDRRRSQAELLREMRLGGRSVCQPLYDTDSRSPVRRSVKDSEVQAIFARQQL